MTKPLRITASATLLLLGACNGGSNADPGPENVVNIYNYADYFASDTLTRFESETGIRVNFDTYDSAEMVDVKMLTGQSGYDVVIHSNRFASRLVPIGIFQKIDTQRLNNFKNLDPVLMERLNRYEKVIGYNIPYSWGTTGYAWNVDMVRERLPDHPMDSADILFEPELIAKLQDCGVSYLDGPSDVFPMALAYLGMDPTISDPDSIAAAEKLTLGARPFVRYFSNGKMLSDLPNQEVCVAMSWSGDYATAAARAREANLDIELRYTTPKEGSMLWADGIYIPADAPHSDNAYRFIDFILRADVSADIVNEVNYANANRASWARVAPEILADPAIFPDEELWSVIFAVEVESPRDERVRTRAFARLKSGL